MNEKLAFGGVIRDIDLQGGDKRNYDLNKINQNLLGSISVPKSINRPDYSVIPVDMQNQTPSCGAHAGARLKNVLSLKSGGKRLHSSPRFNWHNIKLIDGLPLESGTSINAIFSAMRTKGVCSFDLAGNDTTLDLTVYTNLAVTPEMIADATNNRTDAEAFIYNPTFEQLCDVIDAHGIGIVLLRVGVNMYQPSWAETDILPLNPNKPMSSGHFMTIEGYDRNIGRIYGCNEWSTAWGAKGYHYFDRDYMPFVVAVGTCVDKELITPDVIPPPIVVNGQVVNWYERFIALLKKAGLYKGT